MKNNPQDIQQSDANPAYANRRERRLEARLNEEIAWRERKAEETRRESLSPCETDLEIKRSYEQLCAEKLQAREANPRLGNPKLARQQYKRAVAERKAAEAAVVAESKAARGKAEMESNGSYQFAKACLQVDEADAGTMNDEQFIEFALARRALLNATDPKSAAADYLDYSKRRTDVKELAARDALLPTLAEAARITKAAADAQQTVSKLGDHSALIRQRLEGLNDADAA